MVATKNKRLAQERARQAAAIQRRTHARRRRLIVAGSAIAVVLITLGALVAVKATHTGGNAPRASSTASEGASVLPPSVLAAVAGLPAGVLDQVGTGTAERGTGEYADSAGGAHRRR